MILAMTDEHFFALHCVDGVCGRMARWVSSDEQRGIE